MSINDKPLNFGKYKGYSPNEVAKYDPSYVVWMFKNVKPTPCDEALMNSCIKITIAYEEEKLDDMNFGLDGW